MCMLLVEGQEKAHVPAKDLLSAKLRPTIAENDIPEG